MPLEFKASAIHIQLLTLSPESLSNVNSPAQALEGKGSPWDEGRDSSGTPVGKCPGVSRENKYCSVVPGTPSPSFLLE